MNDILDDLAKYDAAAYMPPPPHPAAIPATAFPDSPAPSVDHRGEIQNVYGGPWIAAGFVRLGTTGNPEAPGADVRWFELLVTV